MQQKTRFSLRIKILLLLTLIPVLTLASYLVLAVRIFKQDKIAYVFDSGLSYTRTFSAQVSSEVNSLISLAKPAIQEFLNKKEFGQSTRALLDTDGNLSWIAVYEVNAGSFKQVGFTEKVLQEGKDDLQRLGNLTELLSGYSGNELVLKVPFKDDKILLMQKFGQTDQSSSFVFIMLGTATDLANNFKSADNETYLIDEKGQILFGPSGMESFLLSQKIGPSLGEILEQKSASGTREIENLNGAELLVSFSKTAIPNLQVVTLVDKKLALSAVDFLLKRSIVFFILLISVATIISLFASGSLTEALSELFQATKKVAQGNFDIRVKIRSNDEVGSLAESFNAMAGEVSRLMGETAEKARMESELKTAQTVQETLFPSNFAEFEGLTIAGYYEPASECGGDWWHYSKIDRKIFLWIGDATGHGAPAALITSAAKSAATIIERLDVEPHQALSLLNKSIFDVSKGKIMMTFFIGCLDLDTKEFTYANASHEPPFLIKGPQFFKNGTEKISKKDLIPLNETQNPRLGQNRESEFEQVKIKLDTGDRILYYTDGIPDIENPKKEPWGERQFIKGIIESNQNFPQIEEAVRELALQFSSFREQTPLKDDITFFMTLLTGDTQ